MQNRHTHTMRTAIGMMSGTSVDGTIDVAIIHTDGRQRIERKASYTHCYEDPLGTRPFFHLVRASELALHETQGDQQAADSLLLRHRTRLLELATSRHVSGDHSAHIEAAEALLNEDPSASPLQRIAQVSSQHHMDAIAAALTTLAIEPNSIDIIGYHGQTVFHAPRNKMTIQLGKADELVRRFHVPVVSDFRRNDMEHGGQGAPLAPIYHHALASASSLDRVAVLNIGGSANVTFVTQNEEDLFAFDTGPGNALLDRFMLTRTGLAIDRNGEFGLHGQVSTDALQALIERSCIMHGENFLARTPPKSLDVRDFHLVAELDALSTEDGAATLAAFTAECVARSLTFATSRGIPHPTLWILCGGGTRNPVIVRELTSRIGERSGTEVLVEPAEKFGWSSTSMEAELFAFLAVRSLEGLPLSFPGTTGVKAPTRGGVITRP